MIETFNVEGICEEELRTKVNVSYTDMVEQGLEKNRQSTKLYVLDTEKIW